MKVEGSCHCGAVRFSVVAYAPVPYLRCYCSICRKTAGGGGYAINLGAKAETLTVEGEDAITVFHARIEGEESPAERRFCSRCGSALWLWDPRWPDLRASVRERHRHPAPRAARKRLHHAGLEGELGARRCAPAGRTLR